MEIYTNFEFRKMIMDVDNTDVNNKITYIWLADYADALNPKWYSSNADKARPIWKIKKMVEITVGSVKVTETFYPNASIVDNFVWDDRASLTYV